MERQKRLTAAGRADAVGGAERGRAAPPGRRPAVMRDQLAHIADVAGLGNVTVQVLPYTAGAHPAMLGSFTLMQFPDPADRDVVYLEAETGALYLEKHEDVRRYSLILTTCAPRRSARQSHAP